MRSCYNRQLADPAQYDYNVAYKDGNGTLATHIHLWGNLLLWRHTETGST